MNFRINQAAMFAHRSVWERVGFLNESCRYAMVGEWYWRALAAGYRPKLISTYLAQARYHPDAKTIAERWAFPFEYARVALQLARRGTFRFLPTLHLVKGFLWRGLKARSDFSYHQGRRCHAAMFVLAAWLVSGKIRGGNHLFRLRRALFNHQFEQSDYYTRRWQ